jgi:RHS repeat-associated protein
MKYLNSFTPTAPSNLDSTNHLQPATYVAGNQTAIGGYTFTYDAENRVSTSKINSSTTSYVYDGNGHRVMKSTGTAATTYVYDAMNQLIAEYGTPSAVDTGTKYVSVDHLGSTRLVTDTSSPTPDQEICYDFLPFGELIPSGTDGRSGCYGSTATPLTQKFTGKERDAETNNDFFQARYMSAPQGRFTSADPLGNFVASAADPQSWNMYSYARNNPLAFIDPSGYDSCETPNGETSPSDDFGGVDSEVCGDLGGTWQSSWDITDNVNQYNAQQITLNPDPDGWLNLWSAENGPMGAGYTFSITGSTTPLRNPNAPWTLTPTSQGPPVQSVPLFTIAVGTSGGCNLGPVNGVAFWGFAFDSHGNSGLYGGYGGGPSAGAQCSVGIQASVSNGNSICAFGGPFYNLGGTGGFGLAGTADYIIGEGTDQGARFKVAALRLVWVLAVPRRRLTRARQSSHSDTNAHRTAKYSELL